MVQSSMLILFFCALGLDVANTAASTSNVCLEPGKCSSEPSEIAFSVDEESLSLVQLRASQRQAQRQKSRYIPEPGKLYQMEAYLVEFKSYNLDKCGQVDVPKQFVRWGGVANKSTGCLTFTGMRNWFSDTGFSNCYSSIIAEDPEMDISFEAYHNQAGETCDHDLQDTCHVHEIFRLSTTEITDINVWLNGKLGSHEHAHEMYFVYRLIEITTTTTTTPAPAVCKVFGDPHITSFDNAQVSLLKVMLLANPEHGKVNVFENGDFWLVKNDLVNIQGRFHTHAQKKRSYLRVLAVGGPFLQNNTLIIGGYGPKGAKVFWNEEEILPTVGSMFENQYITAYYKNDTQLVQDADRTAKQGFEINLPLNMQMLVNRGHNGLGLMITSPKLPGQQDGECGNYNGDTSDDTAEMIADRIGNRIPDTELLFLNGRKNGEDKPSEHSVFGWVQSVSHPDNESNQ